MRAFTRAQLAGFRRLGQHMVRGLIHPPELPYKVEFLITGRCNCRCRTCGIWTRQTSTEQELSAARIIRAGASLAGDLLWLGISGGEPTLREDFPDIVAGIRARCPNLVLLNFGSNGLSPERLEAQVRELLRLPIPFVVCALSLDGIGRWHDTARGVGGAFERLMESARRLKEIEARHPAFSLGFQTTVSAANHAHVHEIPPFLRRHFPGHVYLATLATASHLVGRGAQEDLSFSPRLSEAVSRLTAQSPLTGPFDLIPLAYLGLAPEYLKTRKSPVPCQAGRDLVMIDPEGRVFPCDYLGEPLGRLSDWDDDLRRLLLDPAVMARRRALGNCAACFSPCQAYPSLIRRPDRLVQGLWRRWRGQRV